MRVEYMIFVVVVVFLGRVYREEVVDGFLFERVKYSVKVIKPYKVIIKHSNSNHRPHIID